MILIGLTWDTTTTVASGNPARIAATARRTRIVTARNDSPPGGATDGDSSHRVSSSGDVSRTSAKVLPSHAPKSHLDHVGLDPHSARRRTASPRSAAPVWRQRDSGDVITAATVPARLATRTAVASACAIPSSDSGTSPRPE